MARAGMEVDQVAAAGKALKDRAAEIDSLVAKLDGIVRTMPSVWDGPDSQQFVNDWWPEHKRTLVAASSHVAGLGQSALNNASEQREASGVGGGGSRTPFLVPPQHAPLPVPESSPGGHNGALSPGGGVEGYLSTVRDRGDGYDQWGKMPGNCTSWAGYRRSELGLAVPAGHGGAMGHDSSVAPTLGAVASYGHGTDTDPGHVMIVEEVTNGGNTIRVSEMNINGQLNALRDTRTFTQQGGLWVSSIGDASVQLKFTP